MKSRPSIIILILSAGIFLSSCSVSDVEDLQDIDNLVLKLNQPDMQNLQFSFDVETRRSYGCDAFLTGRLVRGKAFLAMEVFGVVRGRAGCSQQGAGDLAQTVKMGDHRSFDLELRYKKQTDLYHLRIIDGKWQAEKKRTQLGSELQITE